MNIEKSAIEEVMYAARRLDERGLVNAYEGNISLLRGGLVYVTPTRKSKATLTPHMIAVINQEGEQVAGDFAPTSELHMHLDAYKIRDSIGGIVHAHPPFLTAHALTNRPVTSRAYPEMIAVFGDIPCVPYGRPGTPAILAGAVHALQTRDVILLNNHGALAVGADALEALANMEAGESTAKNLYYARQMGGAADLPDKEVEYLQAQFEASRGEK